MEDLTDILVISAKQCAPKQKRNHSKKKCKGWNNDISLACRDSKITLHKWKVAGRPVDPNNQFYIDMKEKKKKYCINLQQNIDKHCIMK